MQNDDSKNEKEVSFENKASENLDIKNDKDLSSEVEESFKKTSNSALDELNQALSSQDLPEGMKVVSPVENKKEEKMGEISPSRLPRQEFLSEKDKNSFLAMTDGNKIDSSSVTTKGVGAMTDGNKIESSPVTTKGVGAMADENEVVPPIKSVQGAMMDDKKIASQNYSTKNAFSTQDGQGAVINEKEIASADGRSGDGNKDPVSPQETKQEKTKKEKSFSQEPLISQESQEISKPQEQDLDEEVNLQAKPKEEDNQKKNPEKIPQIAIRTFRSDLAEVVKKNKISIDKAFLAEQKKEGNSSLMSFGDKKINYKTKKNLFFSFFSLFLVFAGVFAVYWVYSNKPTPLVKVDEVEVKTFIYPEYQREIFVDSESIIKLTDTIRNELKNSSLPIGSVLHLFLTKKHTDQKNITGKSVLETEELFALINSRVSSNFVRFLEKDFMYGFYSSLDIYPFLIFKTNSFDHSFPEMLAWEKNLMEDLRPLLVEDNPSISTIDLRNSVFEFKDVVLNNIDARAVLDERGEIIFVYSFVDANTLVITTNKNVLKEIVSRLTIRYRER